MKTLGRVLAVGAALVLAGCADTRKDAERTLREVGAQPVRREAAKLYKDVFAAPAGRSLLISLNKCPPTFQRFGPLQVRAYPDGFALALRNAHGGEEGVYIVPSGMDHEPPAGPSARFQKLDDGIYWYWFTQ